MFSLLYHLTLGCTGKSTHVCYPASTHILCALDSCYVAVDLQKKGGLLSRSSCSKHVLLYAQKNIRISWCLLTLWKRRTKKHLKYYHPMISAIFALQHLVLSSIFKRGAVLSHGLQQDDLLVSHHPNVPSTANDTVATFPKFLRSRCPENRRERCKWSPKTSALKPVFWGFWVSVGGF